MTIARVCAIETQRVVTMATVRIVAHVSVIPVTMAVIVALNVVTMVAVWQTPVNVIAVILGSTASQSVMVMEHAIRRPWLAHVTSIGEDRSVHCKVVLVKIWAVLAMAFVTQLQDSVTVTLDLEVLNFSRPYS